MPTPPPVQKDEAAKSSETARRFEFCEGKANKFWEIQLKQSEVRVRYGRIGSVGQSSAKSFSDAAAAAAHAAKIIEEKTSKGYREVR